jgi:glycosyltransferase involved in cell wall biosynthesis
MALLARQSISVVFPAYNEEENLEKAILQAEHCLQCLTPNWEIIVVNDGSHDRTGEIADTVALRDPRVIAVHHRNGNRGYGAALRSGIQRASKDLLFFSDSDLQFHLAELPLLLLWIEQYDAVIGYRGKRNDPLHRKFNAFGWNLLVRGVLGLTVRDIDCAFKLFRTSLFQAIKIDAVGAMVNTDILVQATRMGFKIKEVPVTHFARMNGQSTGANLRVIAKAVKELMRLYFKLRTVSPMVAAYDRRREQVKVPSEIARQRVGQRRSVSLPINFPDRRRRTVNRAAYDPQPAAINVNAVVRNIFVDDK